VEGKKYTCSCGDKAECVAAVDWFILFRRVTFYAPKSPVYIHSSSTCCLFLVLLFNLHKQFRITEHYFGLEAFYLTLKQQIDIQLDDFAQI
jgi:hypothetical protein